MDFIKPEEVIKNFDLERGMVVADFGCGSGHYVMLAAKMVGDDGKVYAIDVQKDLLMAIKSNAQNNDLKNIEIVWADLELPGGLRLADGVVDFVIISNLLFQVEERSVMAKEAFRVLKKGGKAAVIDWEKTPSEGEKIGPLIGQRIAKEEAKTIFLQEGFALEKEFLAGGSHYGIIFVK